MRDAVDAFLDNKEQESVSAPWLRKLKREMLDFAVRCDAKVLYRERPKSQSARILRTTGKTGKRAGRPAQATGTASLLLQLLPEPWRIEKERGCHLSKIRVAESPTLPLTREQFDTMVNAVIAITPRHPIASGAGTRPWRCCCCCAGAVCASMTHGWQAHEITTNPSSWIVGNSDSAKAPVN